MCTKPDEINCETKGRIEAIASEFGSAIGTSPFAVYVILDPARPDPSGTYPGLPLYVGESSNPAGRARSHLRHALGGKGSELSVQAEILRMIAAGNWPIFAVLEKCKTRADSLEAELRWSQQLLRQGYRLFNRLPGQSRIIAKPHYNTLISNRVWKLTVREADSAYIRMTLACTDGCFETEVNIRHYASPDFPSRKLSALKNTIEPCARCGSRLAIKVREQNGRLAVWSPADE